MKLVATLHNPVGSCDETNSPTCHCIGFADTIDDDDALFDFGELCHACVLADIVDVLVNLVGNDDDLLVTKQDILQRFEFLLAVNRAGRVTGRAKDERLCLGRDGGFELLGRNLEVLLDSCFYENRSAFCQENHLRIAYPIGSGDNDLVACIHDGHDGVADALLRAVTAKDLAGSIVETVLVLELSYDGFFQFGIAWNGRVAAIVLLDCLDGRSLNMVGRVEVGFAHTHVNHVHAFSFEFAASLTHGQGCTW